MLTITVPSQELWDEANEEFVNFEETTLELEHSLVAISKWESKYKKPFLETSDKTREETLGYVEAMCLTPNTAPEVFHRLSNANLEAVQAYISDTMTATWFNENNRTPKSREKITSELVYHWMTSLNIDWQAQDWHINRLLTLIRIFGVKNAKPEKMSRADQMARRREINERNKKRLGTDG